MIFPVFRIVCPHDGHFLISSVVSISLNPCPLLLHRLKVKNRGVALHLAVFVSLLREKQSTDGMHPFAVKRATVEVAPFTLSFVFKRHFTQSFLLGWEFSFNSG
jgi:hypothetical protein